MSLRSILDENKITKPFFVIGVDTFDGTDWVEGQFDAMPDALNHAMRETAGKQMLKMFVYNRDGSKLHGSFGTF